MRAQASAASSSIPMGAEMPVEVVATRGPGAGERQSKKRKKERKTKKEVKQEPADVPADA